MPTPEADTKAELRSRMRRVRRAIPDRDARTERLWANVIVECRRVGAGTVLAYAGVGSEPDTTELITGLHAAGHTVLLPRVEGEQMHAVVLHPGASMDVGPYGIPAPSGEPWPPELIDAVVVPGLAFTQDGRRLGQGGGFYDRFLPRLRAGALRIGACFVEQVVEHLPFEPHDQSVDVVITDVGAPA